MALEWAGPGLAPLFGQTESNRTPCRVEKRRHRRTGSTRVDRQKRSAQSEIMHLGVLGAAPLPRTRCRPGACHYRSLPPAPVNDAFALHRLPGSHCVRRRKRVLGVVPQLDLAACCFLARVSASILFGESVGIWREKDRHDRFGCSRFRQIQTLINALPCSSGLSCSRLSALRLRGCLTPFSRTVCWDSALLPA